MSRPVTCLETGESFPSGAAAARALSLSYSKVCRAAKYGNKVHGYHFYHTLEGMPYPSFFTPSSEGLPVPVIQEETGVVYPSIRAAARATGIPESLIKRTSITGAAAKGCHFRRLK